MSLNLARRHFGSLKRMIILMRRLLISLKEALLRGIMTLEHFGKKILQRDLDSWREVYVYICFTMVFLSVSLVFLFE